MALRFPVDGAASPVLTVDIDQLFHATTWGQRFKAEFDAETAALAAENDRLYQELAAEEAELTAARQKLSQTEFRTRAEAFDKKAESIRREWERRRVALAARPDAELAAFRRASLPVFEAVMKERGALAILDRSAVYLARDVIDVTEVLARRIDSEIGNGQGIATPVPAP